MGKQIKICTDPACSNAHPKKGVSAKFNYCPICGAALSFACANCKKPIEIAPEDKKTCLCPECTGAKEEKKEYGKQYGVAAGAGAAAVIGGILWLQVGVPAVATIERAKTAYAKINKKGSGQRGGIGSGKR